MRLSAADHIAPWSALAGAARWRGWRIGVIELVRRMRKRRTPVDPIEANALRGGRMSLRDSLVVAVQTLISNGCGASVGLEAGYTQIGAGLACRLGLALRLRRTDLRIMVGAARRRPSRRRSARPDHRRLLRLRADRRRLFGRQRRRGHGRLAGGVC